MALRPRLSTGLPFRILFVHYNKRFENFAFHSSNLADTFVIPPEPLSRTSVPNSSSPYMLYA